MDKMLKIEKSLASKLLTANNDILQNLQKKQEKNNLRLNLKPKVKQNSLKVNNNFADGK